jgi:hypothetical protein
MRLSTPRAGQLAGVLLAAALAAPLPAQDPPPQMAPDSAQRQPRQPIADVEIVSEREVFSYPSFQRRNPFRPLVGDESGPRFEQVELRGIIYDRSGGGRSVAVLGLRAQAERQIQQIIQRQVTAQESTTAARPDTIYVPEPTERLRAGQQWGNMRVARIEEDHVVLNVTEFGITEQRILRIVVRRQGGPS